MRSLARALLLLALLVLPLQLAGAAALSDADRQAYRLAFAAIRSGDWQGAYAQARSTLLDVLDLERAMGDDRMVPTVLMNLAETEFALGDAHSAVDRAEENLCNDVVRKSCDMLATQEANLSAYLLTLGQVDEARAMALASIDDASGSFPAVPLQHFAATIVEVQPRMAARLWGYVDAVFTANAFSREYTERYTYERLAAALHESLGDDAVNMYRREGALMSAEQAVQLARRVNEQLRAS